MMAKVQNVMCLYQGSIFDVFVEKVELPNGVVKNREVVRHPGAAAMVPFLDDDTVVLIKQYRHAVDRFLWEIPAGTLEKGETPLDCAQRELVEEIGYEASTLEKITDFFYSSLFQECKLIQLNGLCWTELIIIYHFYICLHDAFPITG